MENCAVRGKLTVRSGMKILRVGDDPASRLCPIDPPLYPNLHYFSYLKSQRKIYRKGN